MPKQQTAERQRGRRKTHVPFGKVSTILCERKARDRKTHKTKCKNIFKGGWVCAGGKGSQNEEKDSKLPVYFL